MKKAGINFFGASEKLTRGQGDAIGDWAVERLRATILDNRRVVHFANNTLAGFDGIVLMRLDLRQLIEDSLRQITLLKIPNAKVPKNEAAALIGFYFFHIVAGCAIGNLIDFPKHDHLAVLALANRSAELISLLEG